MTRRAIPFPCLEAELKHRMEPVAVKRPGRAMQWLWAYGTFLTGIGVGLAWIVIVGMLPVVWAVMKIRRARETDL